MKIYKSALKQYKDMICRLQTLYHFQSFRYSVLPTWVWPIVLKPVNTRQKQSPRRNILSIFVFSFPDIFIVCTFCLFLSWRKLTGVLIRVKHYKVAFNSSIVLTKHHINIIWQIRRLYVDALLTPSLLIVRLQCKFPVKVVQWMLKQNGCSLKSRVNLV